jgi:hypothetical protein
VQEASFILLEIIKHVFFFLTCLMELSEINPDECSAPKNLANIARICFAYI